MGGSGNDLIAGGAGDDNILGDHTGGAIDVTNWQATRQVQTDAQGNVTSASLQFQGMTVAMGSSPGADRVYAGAGNDWVIGGAGADTYTFNLGDDVIFDGDAVAGSGDTLRFGEGILPGSVVAVRSGTYNVQVAVDAKQHFIVAHSCHQRRHRYDALLEQNAGVQFHKNAWPFVTVVQ